MLLCMGVAAVELPAAELLVVASICARAVVQSWVHSLQQTCFTLLSQNGMVDDSSVRVVLQKAVDV